MIKTKVRKAKMDPDVVYVSATKYKQIKLRNTKNKRFDDKIKIKKDFTTVEGIDIHIARKVSKYEFEELYLCVEKNQRNKCFDLYLKKRGDKIKERTKYIKEFENYFGEAIKIHWFG